MYTELVWLQLFAKSQWIISINIYSCSKSQLIFFKQISFYGMKI